LSIIETSPSMTYSYRPEVLEALARHGLRPRPETSPQFLRDAVNDLYRFEIRRLRSRLLAQEFPKSEYIGRVLELRGKYLLLSMPMDEWIADRDASAEP
jgi:hypothetical protein